jgi:hypothetical protein
LAFDINNYINIAPAIEDGNHGCDDYNAFV